MHKIADTPLAFKAGPFSRKPGTCLTLQVGVKAPGTPKRTIFFPAANSVIDSFFNELSSSMYASSPSGILSPTAIRDMVPDNLTRILPTYDRFH
ncbi:hypothetical protein Mapa_014795 [Marchantia paleacea]|nr:hypothetical protein Mapa_014795 [Marchantia paleacea]